MPTAKATPSTKPELSMQVLFGEMVGNKLVARTALIIGFEGALPILEVFRPVAQGKNTQERPTEYSAELADGCWTFPAFAQR